MRCNEYHKIKIQSNKWVKIFTLAYSQAVPNTPYGQLFLIYLVKGFTFAYAFIIPLADHFVTGEQH